VSIMSNGVFSAMWSYHKILDQLAGQLTYKNIFDIICGYEDRVAAEYFDSLDNKCCITYREYKKRAGKAAGGLAHHLNGLRNEFVGLKMANSPDWPSVFWAILISGNKALLLDAEGGPDATKSLLEEVGAVAIVSDRNEQYDGVIGLSPVALMERDYADTALGEFGDQVAMCTSGTTGSVRIFVYDGEAMGQQILNAQHFLKSSKDLIYEIKEGEIKNLAFLPMHHIFGFVAVYMWYSAGGRTIVYLKDRSPETIMKTCRVFSVTHVFSVPLFWNNLASGVLKKVRQGGPAMEKKYQQLTRLSVWLQTSMPRLGRKIVSRFVFRTVQKRLLGTSVRYLISGGGRVLPETLKVINALGYPLYNGFGMTETGITSVEMGDSYAERIMGSVGKPFHSVAYKIASDDGGTGELLIAGASLHSGRMTDGRCVKRANEWFSSGDIGRMQDGRLFIEGRAKEVIIGESGVNVYPDEIEDTFIALPNVSRICILSLDAGNPYEDIALVLEMDPKADERAIEETAGQIVLANRSLPFVKKIRIVLVVEESLPLVCGIKVQRQKLKKLIESGQLRYRVLDLSKKHLFSREYREGSQSYESDPRFLMIKDDVRDMFADVLMMEAQSIHDADHFFDDLGGDSLTIIGLMAKVEEIYSVTVPFNELATLTNVSVTQLSELIYRKLYGAGMDLEHTKTAAV
jgi:acyl carrier protein